MYQLAVLLQFGIFGVSHGLKVVRMMNRFAFFLFSFFLYYDHCIQSVCIPGGALETETVACATGGLALQARSYYRNSI